MAIQEIIQGDLRLLYNEENLAIEIEHKGHLWKTASEYKPYLIVGKEKIYFQEAKQIEHFQWHTGVGEGIRTKFSKFWIKGDESTLCFETIIWIEYATQHLHFELVPLKETSEVIGDVYWPGEMDFKANTNKWYTLINLLQGLMIPNNWPHEVKRLVFDGQMCSSAAYMPWFGQVRDQDGYIAIIETPWDAAYQVNHPADSDFCHIGIRWLPSMGKMNYKRTMKMVFREDCDYNDLCKVYRQYAKEQGLLITLREKAARNPLVDKFIGSAIVHTGIKTHVSPDSAYYDPEHPEKNDEVIPFKIRQKQMEKLKQLGVEKVYLHLDGWGDPGYDNQHPDYLPACIEAGGWEGMKALSDKMKELNYMFAIHDQYRDYYFDAKTYDKNFALQNPDGSHIEFCRWAGGWQTYICATQAPLYLKRNFTELFKQGIQLEGTYLDVFTCNELDECTHPWHRMTRKECMGYRKACFDYLVAHDILPSSEEVIDWAIPSVVTAHYGPYAFMLWPNDQPKGIPVPLFNLVYHDCVVLPWLMKEDAPQGDYMLYALLNGGAAYLDADKEDEELKHDIERYRQVAALQEKVAKCEMVRHEFLNDQYTVQKALYSDGTEITIDLEKGTYKVQ